MAGKKYQIAFIIMIVGWGLATGVSYVVEMIQYRIITAIEMAYECKSQGKTLHQCEHEIKGQIQ